MTALCMSGPRVHSTRIEIRRSTDEVPSAARLTGSCAIKPGAGQYVCCDSVEPDDDAKHSHDPPVYDHPLNPIDELPEEEQVAEFDGGYAGPQQNQTNTGPFLKVQQLRNEVIRDHNLIVTNPKGFQQIHLIHEDEEKGHGGNETGDAEEEKAIVDQQRLLVADANHQASTDCDDGDDKQGYN